MGDAYVAVANDVSSIYWNPVGLASVSNSSALFMVQPWLVEIDMLFAGGAVVVPNVGVIGDYPFRLRRNGCYQFRIPRWNG